MKLSSCLFLALLLLIHIGGDDKLLGAPLSMLRDGDHWYFAYTLFVLLVVIGVQTTWALTRSGRTSDGRFCGLATTLALVAGATPTDSGAHEVAAYTLPVMLFLGYAFRLAAENSFWLFAHLAAPILLLILTRFHSYGLWQKAFIVYLLFALNVHHFLVQHADRRDSAHRRLRKARVATA